MNSSLLLCSFHHCSRLLVGWFVIVVCQIVQNTCCCLRSCRSADIVLNCFRSKSNPPMRPNSHCVVFAKAWMSSARHCIHSCAKRSRQHQTRMFFGDQFEEYCDLQV